MKESAPADGRILFKKPNKRKSEDCAEKPSPAEKHESKNKKKKQEILTMPNLLSFNDDEEEDS